MSIICKVAETEEEKLGAYKLRFQCLTLEGGDTNHADFETQTFKDSIDDSGKCKLLVAIDDQTGLVVSTQRITFRKEVTFIADHIYPYSKLASFLKMTEQEIIQLCVLHDRSATNINYRGMKPGLWSRLFYLCEQLVFDNLSSKGVILGYVRTDNESVAQMLKHKFNWQWFDNRITYKERDFHLYIKLLSS